MQVCLNTLLPAVALSFNRESTAVHTCTRTVGHHERFPAPLSDLILDNGGSHDCHYPATASLSTGLSLPTSQSSSPSSPVACMSLPTPGFSKQYHQYRQCQCRSTMMMDILFSISSGRAHSSASSASPSWLSLPLWPPSPPLASSKLITSVFKRPSECSTRSALCFPLDPNPAVSLAPPPPPLPQHHRCCMYACVLHSQHIAVVQWMQRLVSKSCKTPKPQTLTSHE